jgi:hypothetical protein
LLVSLNKNNEKYEQKVNRGILDNNIETTKENQLLMLRIKALTELINANDANIDILRNTVHIRDEEIKQLKETRDTMRELVENKMPEKTDVERQDALLKLEQMQHEIDHLMKEHEKIEEEKMEQAESILKLNLLIKENFAPNIVEKGIQVNEVRRLADSA